MTPRYRRGVLSRTRRLGAARGVDIHLHASWVLVAPALGGASWWWFATGAGYGHGPVVGTAMALVAVVGTFVSTLVHEMAHAAEAAHRDIDITDVTPLLFGGRARLGDTRTNEATDRSALPEVAVAAVGPFTSLVLGSAAGLVAMGSLTLVRAGYPVVQPLADLAGLLAWINVAVAAVNLLPSAPFDAGRALDAWRGGPGDPALETHESDGSARDREPVS